MRGPLVQTSLQKQLSVTTRGDFQQAGKDQQWAFKPVEMLSPDKQLEAAANQASKDTTKMTPLEEHQYHLQPPHNPSED